MSSVFPPQLSLFLFVFPAFILRLVTCHDLMGHIRRPLPSQAKRHHTHKHRILVRAGCRVIVCVDFMSTGMWLCCCVFMISANVDSHLKPLNVSLKKDSVYTTPESMDTGPIPCSHRIQNNFPKSRKWLYQMPIHTEIYSNTSAWFQSQNDTMLRQERQHKICLSTGPWKACNITLQCIFHPSTHTEPIRNTFSHKVALIMWAFLNGHIFWSQLPFLLCVFRNWNIVSRLFS